MIYVLPATKKERVEKMNKRNEHRLVSDVLSIVINPEYAAKTIMQPLHLAIEWPLDMERRRAYTELVSKMVPQGVQTGGAWLASGKYVLAPEIPEKHASMRVAWLVYAWCAESWHVYRYKGDGDVELEMKGDLEQALRAFFLHALTEAKDIAERADEELAAWAAKNGRAIVFPQSGQPGAVCGQAVFDVHLNDDMKGAFKDLRLGFDMRSGGWRWGSAAATGEAPLGQLEVGWLRSWNNTLNDLIKSGEQK